MIRYTGRTPRIALAALAMSLALAGPSFALTLKIGSIAPENTPFGAALNKMSADWSKMTNGEVDLKIFHNGIAGGEPDTIRKIKIGQIQGGVFTSFGLNTITPEILTLSAPLLIQTNEEFDYIMAKNREIFQKKIEEKGFVVLAWAKAGWVRFFARQPVFVPADLKKMKLATDPADPTLSQAFKTLGYQMVPVALNETVVALSSGMVDAVYISPLAAGGLQFFGTAKYMTDLKVSPFLGAVVVSTTAWNKVPADTRAKLLAYNKTIEKELDASILKLEEDSVGIMQKYGLVVEPITPAQLELWKKDIEIGLPKAMGTSFDKETYDRIAQELVEFRAAKAAGKK